MPHRGYYAALEADMKLRHPKASGSILEHCSALETFLDTSILAGFSFGADKALVAVQKGSLLGHEVSRAGSAPSGERCQAINEFAPLKDQSQVRQFLGCTNWIRWYLPSYYPTAVKLLSEYMKPTAVFPESGLGGAGTLQGDKAVKAIKLMAVHSIETAVFDEAAAIDGSRPLEQVADACGYAWGSTCLQMTADLSRFKVLLMVGKGFTPAQQAWPPLVLEGYAQLMGKRAQRKVLGPMRSVCWTDHANVTKQQVLPSEEIDVKLLRWISEIVADGSEVRSLAGRSAKLGDGTSRNPSDRDELVAQRTKDVKGLIGQVRGFDLDQFLSDWVERGASLPWSIGKHAWVDSEEHEQKTVGALCAAAGVLPKLKVLYVPDYADTTERLAGSSKLACVLQWMLPGREIALAISEGPFEDDDGVGAHFDRQALTEHKPKLQLAALKVDCHTSILKLARSAQLHQPEIIFGTGQGAVVAAGYALPELFEKTLQTRNVQQTEVGGLASAWGNVKVIIIEGPRLSATGLRAAKLKEAVPELYKETSAVEVVPTFCVAAAPGKLYHEIKEFGSHPLRKIVQEMKSIPLQGLLEQKNRLIWEHGGECGCGRRTYLFGQCMKCLAEDSLESKIEFAEHLVAEHPGVEQEEAAGTLLARPAGELLHPGSAAAPAGALIPALVYPQVNTGADTAAVRFVTSTELFQLAESKGENWKGTVHIGCWVRGQSYELPSIPKDPAYPFRIAFIVHSKDQVIPLQQCVDSRRERSHVVLKESWFRESSSLTGFLMGGLTPELERLSYNSKVEVAEIAAAKSIQSTVGICLRVATPMYLVKRKGTRANFENTFAEVLKKRRTEILCAVIIGRNNSSWEYVYIGPWPARADHITKQPSEWLLCIGDRCEWTKRRVLTLFSSKVVVFDWHCKWVRPAGEFLHPAAPLEGSPHVVKARRHDSARQRDSEVFRGED